MRLALLIAPLAAAVLLSGCGSKKSASTATTAPRTVTGVTHAARDLEAMLPSKIGKQPLTKGSTTGAVVFGGDAFSKAMKSFLESAGKSPGDLRFANARSAAAGIEIGAFQVPGITGARLARAIVDASKPDAPTLTATPGKLSGKAVTRVVYPGGSVLYLYPHGDVVFYVGTADESTAPRVLALLP